MPEIGRFHLRPCLRMAAMLGIIGTAILLSGFLMPGWTSASGSVNYADCLACHRGIEPISGRHPFPCGDCHLLPKDRSARTLPDHSKTLRNPSAPRHVETFCGPCHQQEIEVVCNSLHATMAGIINQTRYLWGAQDRAAPGIYGLSGPFQDLPKPPPLTQPETPAMLVDDFLRRRCLRCHIHGNEPQGPGLYRAAGCAACHILYNNEGRYEGADPAIDRKKPGYPARHVFATHIPNDQCLHCHNHNHVGADFEGLFAHDHSDTYRSPRVDGQLQPMRYGLDDHRLARDIHGERGLWCIDCHAGTDVMGDGRAYHFQMEVPKRLCTDCHGGFGGKGPDVTHSAIQREATGWMLISKNQGGRHPLPLFREDSASHRVEAHARVRCSACHAQWSFQDYGMSVMREDQINDYKWRDLSVQGDPYIQEKLKGYAESPDTAYPLSIDYLSGREREGIWSLGWRFRRWEPMPLGVDATGGYAVLRPLYQYLVTHVDRSGKVLLDSATPQRGDGSGRGWAFMPYVPHTIAPFGRACTSCHMNRVAAGLGIQEELTIDTALTLPSPPTIRPMRLLTPQEKDRLLNPSRKWHRHRLEE